MFALAWGAFVVPSGAGAQIVDESGGGGSGAAAFVAKVTAQLKMTPRQEAAFLEYEVFIADPSQRPNVDLDAFRAMTWPQKLDYMTDQAGLAATKLRAQAVAARRFYQILSPDQQKAFDAIMWPPPPSAALPATPLPERGALASQLPSHTEPDWLVKPSAENMARVYPRAARKQRVEGRAVLTCVVDTNGFLSDCAVADETPKDAGFGNAALEVTGYMRMRPATTLGVPVESDVNVPIRFQPDRP